MQDQFVGVSVDECREIGVSGTIDNVEDLRAYELYVQGRKVGLGDIRAGAAPGRWTFSTVVDLFPTAETGDGSDPTFAAEYPRFPWPNLRGSGWDYRVRPFLAELVRPADRANLAAFVSRDVHTAIDVRRSNCRSWDATWTQGNAPGVLTTQLSADGLVALAPMVEAAMPDAALSPPQATIDAAVAGGLVGPSGVESCTLFGGVRSHDPDWELAWAPLLAAAVAANTAAASVGLPPVYPNPYSADNWQLCAGWSSSFDAIGWEDAVGVALDPTPNGVPSVLTGSWMHPAMYYQLIVSAEDVVLRWGGSVAPPLQASVDGFDCRTAGVADVSLETSFSIDPSVDLETLDITTPSLTADATGSVTALPFPCSASSWDTSVTAIFEAGASTVARQVEVALAPGPVSHPAAALRTALEGAIPGRWNDEADGLVTTQPTPDYQGGIPAVCDDANLGLLLVHELHAGPGADGWEGGWLWWGAGLASAFDAISGLMSEGDLTTCDELDYDARDTEEPWTLRGPTHSVSWLSTTAYPNALMAQSTRRMLEGSWTNTDDPGFVNLVAASLGIPRAEWADVVVSLDALQSAFVSPEWVPQVGHWRASVSRASDGQVDTEAVLSVWATSGWDDGANVGGLDDRAAVSFGAVVVEGVAVAGRLRPDAATLDAAFGPRLRTYFAALAVGAAARAAVPEWVGADGGPWFTASTPAPQHWQDNRGLMPYVLVP
jgi:hypothetical protein